MINAIRDIGKYLRSSKSIGEIDIIRSLVNKIEEDTIKEIFLVDIKNNGIVETQSEEFYRDITTKSLFYQAGNGALGGAIRADFFKEDEKDKFDKKIKNALRFCEVEVQFEVVKEKIFNKINEQGNKFLVVILVDGKYPYELFKDKFLDKMYTTMFKGMDGKHICHFCGNNTKGFNTTTYKFYTNDKEVYGNVSEKGKAGVIMCKECLNDVLIAKEYVDKKLTTYWMGKNVMFLPHDFNDDTESLYDNTVIVSGKKNNFISNISDHEESVLDVLGAGNTETDIIFFEKDGNKTYYIYHTIKSMLPSRFSKLAKYLKKYSIKLYQVVNLSTTIKIGKDGPETTNKEKLKLIDAIFTSKKINRSNFFTRSMMTYKQQYIQSKAEYGISNIGKVYNFLVDCGCLKGGFNVMEQYSSYVELFEKNASYFDSNEKKAWFLIGRAYDYVNYLIKKSNSTDDGKISDRSSLDKNFFFARKFNFKDFIYFSNLLNDKIIKYRLSSTSLKSIITEAKELMANNENKLSNDEAKYIFFWGMDSYFKKNEDMSDELDENL